MPLPQFRGVKPQAAQRSDGRWAGSAMVFWEEHGAVVEQELSWPQKDFSSPGEAAQFAHEQGKHWLDAAHPE